MFPSFALRVVSIILALLCVQTAAAGRAAAEEITIPGDQVAEALEQVLSNAQIRLDGAAGSRRRVSGRLTFHDPTGSYIRFGGALGTRRHPIFVGEGGLSVLLGSSDGGGDNFYFLNLSNIDASRVDVTATDDGFDLIVNLQIDDPEVVINCLEIRDSVARTCPASAAAGQGPQVSWNQPIEWDDARMRIKLKPILHGGGMALRVVDAELTGDVDPPDAMGCATANMVPGSICFIIDNLVDTLQGARLTNPRFPHEMAAVTLEKTVARAFDDQQVKNGIALNMVPVLASSNVVGSICRVRMEDGNLVVEGKRGHIPPDAQVPVPPDLIPGGQGPNINPNSPIPMPPLP